MCKCCEGVEDLIHETNDYGLTYVVISENSRGFWLCLDDMPIKRINFCPICGKKLTPFQVNEQ